jgi:hypothetical protein
MSAARIASLIILAAASHALLCQAHHAGGCAAQTAAFITAAAIGSLISCASDAANSAMLITLRI